MKALEAWARGLPLLVDGPTAEVLEAEDGRELVVARDAAGYANALARLVEEDGLRQRVVTGGRRALAERHDPAAIAEHLEKVYRWAMANAGPS
jgi:glycosyltransferase involved in cell wall biosynthesis